MSFFDSKEEVIKIELTQHGKYLLSKGKFDPKYYAFFDDDVVYDGAYIGITESQNSPQQRILEETPYLKPQSNYSSVDNRNTEQVEINLKNNVKDINPLDINSSMLPYPLGTSDPNSTYLPAWNIAMYEGKISSSLQNYVTSSTDTDISYTFLKIPQINMEVGNLNISVADFNYSLQENESVFTVVDDGKKVLISKENLINTFEVIEKNTSDNGENFMLEVFVEENDGWKQLNFYKDPINIKNNILLDDYLYSETPDIIPDEYNVEHYFQILTDQQVYIPNKKNSNIIYDSPITDANKPFGDKC